MELVLLSGPLLVEEILRTFQLFIQELYFLVQSRNLIVLHPVFNHQFLLLLQGLKLPLFVLYPGGTQILHLLLQGPVFVVLRLEHILEFLYLPLQFLPFIFQLKQLMSLFQLKLLLRSPQLELLERDPSKLAGRLQDTFLLQLQNPLVQLQLSRLRENQFPPQILDFRY